MVRVTYYLEVSSSWCFWAEPMWAELKQRYPNRVEFGWKIAQMPAEAYPVSRAQCDWFYRRSGTAMRSPFMLNSGWFEPEIKQYTVPNLVAEAAKDFAITDDRVRLAIARAGMRDGKKIGRWEVAVAVGAEAGKLDSGALLARAKSPEVAARVVATSAEFDSFQINQRPAFLFENSIGDRALFSGVVRAEPMIAALDTLLMDEAAYESFATHFGGPPAA